MKKRIAEMQSIYALELRKHKQAEKSLRVTEAIRDEFTALGLIQVPKSEE